MSAALVTPTTEVPLSAVSAAAIEVCGRGSVWLDTGGLTIGIRVPEDRAKSVWQLAKSMAGAADQQPDGEQPADGLKTTPLNDELGRPSCSAQPAAQRPAQSAFSTSDKQRGARSEKNEVKR